MFQISSWLDPLLVGQLLSWLFLRVEGYKVCGKCCSCFSSQINHRSLGLVYRAFIVWIRLIFLPLSLTTFAAQILCISVLFIISPETVRVSILPLSWRPAFSSPLKAQLRWVPVLSSLPLLSHCEVTVVVQLLSCVWFCDPIGYRTPGFSVLHCLLEFAQIHVHWVGGDAV